MQSTPSQSPDLAQGLVTRKNRGQYLVRMNGREVPCTISNRLRKQLLYPTADPASRRRRVIDVREIDFVDPIAVGDQVAFIEVEDGTGHIVMVLPRRTKLSRWAAGSAVRRDDSALHMEQVLVANVEQIVLVFAAAQPKPAWQLLDRYLVTAEAAGIPALICITKMDLVKANRLEAALNIYRSCGYPVVQTSTVDGRGIETIREAFSGKLSALMGKSGVGKTSLLNAIEPDLGLRVNAVRERDGKGRHTTTHVEIFPLSSSGGVVDTPGMREFALWHLEGPEIASYFPEMRPYLGQCKFGASCRHENEPGCAIQDAVAAGAIAEARYQSFLKMASE
ncbi:MAG: ribosome small subunit-dependent GTPase A [Anaerolineae bacterium]|nr:ribosome small subunit-dependent GTPase A [Anaerolineae bacterium]